MNGWWVFAIFIVGWVGSIFYLVRIRQVTGVIGSVGGGFVITIMLLTVVGVVDQWLSPSTAPPASAAQPSALCNQSSWDSSVPGVEEYLKANLNDPSYERVEWSTVIARPTGYAVRFKYRARNAFGALILQHQVFSLDASCKVTSVVEYQQES